MEPSGQQWTITRGEHRVTVTEVGATLRTYTYADRPVVAGFGADEVCPHARGTVLVPWVNRVRDGRYTWDGREHQLALTEPARRTALHGLVHWLPWTARRVEPDRVTLAVRLHPQQGWDWPLDVTLDYRLDDDGLVVTPTVRNLGDTDAPLAVGAHPYLTVGEVRVDDLEIRCPAATYVLVDPDRLLLAEPTVAASSRPVEGTPKDLRATTVGDRELDVALTDLAADPDGRWRITVSHGGRSTTLWAQADAYPWTQVYTGHDLPEGYRRTSGLAVEPLTAAPEALTTGEGLVRLAPGATWSASWGITPS
ncbi:aldose 1-epimerase family protein [Arsenicicoccus sp. oral taxon 190]|uniref:aldose 1-epimerase family protein n=1 Tax=Arsenicicoccus sp. oral taxon 190 TaxID=1658671 RepID=UPI000679EFAE|nr:aldose 1-epimerase family protein [Arsenicicoccus sp. oral taxon 190]AKT52487.1 hypothetical protein ADJ73_00890 [Arsenicicoccus sp. oral taxon 190]